MPQFGEVLRHSSSIVPPAAFPDKNLVISMLKLFLILICFEDVHSMLQEVKLMSVASGRIERNIS
jgi:hypothetical protein